MVRVLGCKEGRFPIPYLGIKAGGWVGGMEGWKEVVEKIKGILRHWDTSTLSLGWRITIIKSILAAVPLYHMSFLPLPKKIVCQIRSLQCSFLWGRGMGEKKCGVD